MGRIVFCICMTALTIYRTVQFFLFFKFYINKRIYHAKNVTVTMVRVFQYSFDLCFKANFARFSFLRCLLCLVVLVRSSES